MNIQPPQDSQPMDESQTLSVDDSQPVEDLFAQGLAPEVDTEDQGGEEAMVGEGENGEEESSTDDEVVEPVVCHELAEVLKRRNNRRTRSRSKVQHRRYKRKTSHRHQLT